MKIKVYCRRCGEQLLSDGGYCHCCRENKSDAQVEERYFPDNPKNKVYAVDVYVTMCKCVKVEAKDADKAYAKIEKIVEDGLNSCCGGHETCQWLQDNGFHDAEEIDLRVSGEADKNGDIGYY